MLKLRKPLKKIFLNFLKVWRLATIHSFRPIEGLNSSLVSLAFDYVISVLASIVKYIRSKHPKHRIIRWFHDVAVAESTYLVNDIMVRWFMRANVKQCFCCIERWDDTVYWNIVEETSWAGGFKMERRFFLFTFQHCFTINWPQCWNV